MRMDASPTSTGGIATTKKAQRHPSSPPTHVAMPPTRSGPMSWPTGRPMPSNAKIRERAWIG